MQQTDHDLLIQISTKVDGLDARFSALDTRLDRLDSRLDAIAMRVSGLEYWRWYVVGASSAFGVVGTVVGFYIGVTL